MVPSDRQQAYDSLYFLRLAECCYRAARECLELHAKEEFRLLGDEFTQKARELKSITALSMSAARSPTEKQFGNS